MTAFRSPRDTLGYEGGPLLGAQLGAVEREHGYVNTLFSTSGTITALTMSAHRVDDRARGQLFESRLANALDMAGGEAEVVEVIERSFAMTVPNASIELLLADNSHAHLKRMASASPTGVPHGCSVGPPENCPAARRAQVRAWLRSVTGRAAEGHNLPANCWAP